MHLKSLEPFSEGIMFWLDGEAIIIGDGENILGMIREEIGALELSFDPSCPYNKKISIVKHLRKTLSSETLIIGPDIRLVPVQLKIS